ncbi:MAG: hypothetical protein JW874_13460 [Spirochaetales bacterium]|nr:hypothetical protein [Spirochaetales bacterium]
MDITKKPIAGDHIICVYDLVNFVRTVRKLSTEEIFELVNGIQILTIRALLPWDPVLIKNVGDANLIILTTDRIDEKVLSLFGLKREIEKYMSDRGHGNQVSFSCHYGELVAGTLGIPPFDSTDAFGESINLCFLMNGKPFKGRFAVSPQLFRKLDSNSRKIFHKFTPQIVYLADE